MGVVSVRCWGVYGVWVLPSYPPIASTALRSECRAVLYPGLILHQIFLVNEYEVNISRTALVGPRS